MKKTLPLLFAVCVSALGVLPCSAQTAVQKTPATLEQGRAVYSQTCATCHMSDGGGVPNMQPSLVDDAVVKGDPATFIRVVIQGPAKVLPADREPFANEMPAFDTLEDEQIAALLTYIRHEYGGGASAIDTKQVTAVRALLVKKL